jgi:hypothetical protein
MFMQTITLDAALDAVMLLPIEERDELLDIVRKRQRDIHHEQWLREANEAMEMYRKGELKAQSVAEIMAELDASTTTTHTEFAPAFGRG